jgi:hypothetical protein
MIKLTETREIAPYLWGHPAMRGEGAFNLAGFRATLPPASIRQVPLS